VKPKMNTNITNKPRSLQWRFVEVLFACIALISTLVIQTGCGSTGPTEQEAENALSQFLEEKTQGFVRVKTFRKTDGLESSHDASRVYALVCSFQLEIFDRFRDDNFHADIPNGGHEIDLQLTKFEKGWRVTHADAKGNAVLDEAYRRVCSYNRVQIDGAKEVWAFERKERDGTPVVKDEIDRSMKGGPRRCPSGGSYTYNVVGESPRCSVHGIDVLQLQP
jgi:hypothetical protein